MDPSDFSDGSNRPAAPSYFSDNRFRREPLSWDRGRRAMCIERIQVCAAREPGSSIHRTIRRLLLQNRLWGGGRVPNEQRDRLRYRRSHLSVIAPVSSQTFLTRNNPRFQIRYDLSGLLSGGPSLVSDFSDRQAESLGSVILF